MKDNKAIEFLANMLNAKYCQSSMPVRWLCLREDLKEKYLSEARKIVSAWWKEEEEAKRRRKSKEYDLPPLWEEK